MKLLRKMILTSRKVHKKILNNEQDKIVNLPKLGPTKRRSKIKRSEILITHL